MALWGKSELIYKDGRVNVHFTEKEIRSTVVVLILQPQEFKQVI